MGDERVTDTLLDLFVYAPIGLALEARELIPKLADRGRGQVALTRLAGTVAARQGGGEARRIIDQIIATVATVIDGEAGDPAPPDADPDAGDGEEPGDGLPIDDYDSLTAPQLLPFLSELSDADLSAVLDHESRHRRRATIINRIHQLQR